MFMIHMLHIEQTMRKVRKSISKRQHDLTLFMLITKADLDNPFRSFLFLYRIKIFDNIDGEANRGY